MNPSQLIEDLSERLSAGLPPGLMQFKSELKQHAKQILQEGLDKLDIVTREEFELQSQLLARTRSKLDQIEEKLSEIENNDHKG